METVFDLTELTDEDRSGILQLNPAQMNDVAVFCNQYPSVDLSFKIENEVICRCLVILCGVVFYYYYYFILFFWFYLLFKGQIAAGTAAVVSVTLQRPSDEAGSVVAPFYPGRREEGWWVVLGHVETSR